MNSRTVILSAIFIITAMTFQSAQGQEKKWFLAGGITYCSFINNPGLNVSLTYRLVDNLYIGPDFSALLTKIETSLKRKELEYNFNAHYTLELTSFISVYPLTGINFSKTTTHEKDHEPQKQFLAAFNIGGGLEFRTGETGLFVESKHVSRFDKYDITVGVIIGF